MHPLNRVLHPLARLAPLPPTLLRLATRVFHVTNKGLLVGWFPKPQNSNPEKKKNSEEEEGTKIFFILVGGVGWVGDGGTHYLSSGKSGLTGVAFVSAQ